jgi:hypothetical protein
MDLLCGDLSCKDVACNRSLVAMPP